MKARRLSDKKIHIACETKIFFINGGVEVLLDTITTRFVYKRIHSTYVDGTPVSCYYANIKPGFVAGICNKYGIKKKFVFFPDSEEIGKKFEVDVDGEKLLVAFNDIILTDKDWYTAWNRERLLKSLLEV
jgi:hypothetical protein